MNFRKSDGQERRHERILSAYADSGLNAELHVQRISLRRVRVDAQLKRKDDASLVSTSRVWGSVKSAVRGTLLDVAVMKALRGLR